MNTTLYQQDARGDIREWSIEVEDNSLHITHGLYAGCKQYKTEVIKSGLGGRTLEEQVKSRYYSRINEMYKKGYKNSPSEAKNLQGTNAIGFKKPMLAQPLSKVKGIDYSTAYIQHKYDGHRCLITKRGGKMVAYSRQGKVIHSIDHILESIVLPDGLTIDGELYCHGASLQTITSWVKREQQASANLQYHAYDIMIDKPYKERYDRLADMVIDATKVMVVPTMKLISETDVPKHFEFSREQGYEGSIIRWGTAGYEASKRSKHLVKVKEFLDDEFLIVEVHKSKDDWGIFECSTKTGTSFRVTAPGTMEEKEVAWLCRDSYIGKYVTVEYANLTKDGVPFHPIAIRVREDI